MRIVVTGASGWIGAGASGNGQPPTRFRNPATEAVFAGLTAGWARHYSNTNIRSQIRQLHDQLRKQEGAG